MSPAISSSTKELSKELAAETAIEKNSSSSLTKQNTSLTEIESKDEMIQNEHQTNKIVLSVLDVEITSLHEIPNTLKEYCNNLIVNSAKNYGWAYQIVSPKSLSATLDILEAALQFHYELPAGEIYIYPNVLLKTICIIPDKNSIDITASLIEQKTGVILKQARKSGLLKDLPLLFDRVTRTLLIEDEKLIIIDSYPQGADTYIKEGNSYANIGKTPVFVYKKNNQDLEISLKKKGYINIERILTIDTDARTFTLKLQPETKGVLFFLETGVPNARVFVNDEYVAITGIDGQALLPPFAEGVYTLTITAKDYKPYQGSLEITSLNLSRTVKVQMVKK